MAYTISVLGVGPGSKDYLTNIATRKLKSADVVVASRRLLKEFTHPGQKTYPITGDLPLVVDYIQTQSKNRRVVVLVSGDSGLYSFANYLAKQVDDLSRLEIIPGISSVQLLFAKLKRPWEQVVIISAHGRQKPRTQLLTLVQQKIPLAVLTGGNNTPQAIATWLLAQDCDDIATVVGANLSYYNEVIYQGLLSDTAAYPHPLTNSVLVIGHV